MEMGAAESGMCSPTRVRDTPREVSLPVDLQRAEGEIRAGGACAVAAWGEPPERPWYWQLKRAFDLLVAGSGLVLSAPFFAVIAVAIKLDSPGPVLLRQPCVGERGPISLMVKFLTMVAGRRLELGSKPHKHQDDPRVTRVGCLPRRTILNELLQLWSILRDGRSLVRQLPGTGHWRKLCRAPGNTEAEH